MFQPTKYFRIFGSVFLLILIGLGTLAASDVVGRTTKEITTPPSYYTMDIPIVILYDPTDRVTNFTASALCQNFKQIYQNTILKPIVDRMLLHYYLKKYGRQDAVFIHVFQSSLTEVDLGYENLKFREWFTILLSTTKVHHVLAIGNGRAAYEALAGISSSNKDMIYLLEEADHVDAMIMFASVFWVCGEIFLQMGEKDMRYDRLAKDLQVMAAHFFAANIDEVIKRENQPVDILGEEDVLRKETMLQQELDKRNPPMIKAIEDLPDSYTPPFQIVKVKDPSLVQPGEMISTDPEAVRPEALILLQDNETGDEEKDWRIWGEDKHKGTHGFNIGSIPEITGCQSAIAKVTDPVLKVILTLGNLLGIGRETIELLVKSMEIVENVTGFYAGGFEEGTDLGEFVNNLRTQFPYSDEFLPFFDLIGDSLPKLRSNLDATLSPSEWSLQSWTWLLNTTAQNIGGSLSDWLLNSFNDTFSAIYDSLSSGTDLWGNASNYVQAMLGDMASIYLQEVTDRLFKSLGYSSAEINATMPLWNATFDFVARLLAETNHTYTATTGWDFTSSMFWTYFPNSTDMVSEASALNRAGALLEYILGLCDFSEAPLRILLQAVLENVLPPNFTSDWGVFDATLTALIAEIDTAVQSQQTSISTFETLVQFALANNLQQSRADWTDFITNLILFTASSYNEAFLIPDDFPTVQSLFSQLLDLLETDGISITNTTRNNWETLARSLIGILAVTYDSDKIKRMMGGTLNGYTNIVFNNMSIFIQDLCGLLLNSTDLSDSAVKQKVTDFADTLLGIYQMLADGKENPVQSVFQTLMLTTAYGIIKDYEGEEIGISFLKSLTQWLLDSYYQEYSEQTFLTPNDNEILTLALTNIVAAVNLTYYLTTAQPILMNLIRTRFILTGGTRWFYTQLMTWQERKVQELTITIIRDIYNAISGGNSLLARAKTKEALESLGYREKIENDPQFADLRGISMEKNVITVSDDVQAKSLAQPPAGAPGENKSSYKGQFSLPFSYAGKYNIGIGKYVGITLAFQLGIDIQVKFLVDEFSIWLGQQILGGSKDLLNMTASEALWEMMKFLQITPVFFFDGSISTAASAASKVFMQILKFIGKIEVGGGLWIRFSIFSVGTSKALDLSWNIKIIEFGVKFWFAIGITIKLSEIVGWVVGAFTAGAGKTISVLMQMLGLDVIQVTPYIRLYWEIMVGAPTGAAAIDCVMKLILTFGLEIKIGFEPLWGLFKATITITIEIAFTFILDFARLAVGEPWLEIWFDLKIKIAAELAFIVLSVSMVLLDWHPVHLLLTPKEGDPDPESPGDFGPDEDKDGLGDIFESIIPGLNKSSADTDGDLLSDKFEYYISRTNPAQADTDGDGLDDYQEYNVTRTNPLFEDTDFDGLTDYEEVILYITSPFEIDTDGDGLDDRFEVKTAWDITTVTPSVTEVMIGNVAYPNRTDPLNPDTDGDGLLDGEEGPRGIWYGAQFLFDAENEKIDTDGDGKPDTAVNRPAGNPREDAAPIIYNHGFTHPLDNDTDDDSYEQMWNGKISPRRKWLRSMSDGDEVFGMWITFINKWGEPTLNFTRTNPTCPDTDGDTGRPDLDFGLFSDDPPNDNVTQYYNYFLNSDGYELSLQPPSDPNDGDSDDDGLIDGIEGTLRPDSNHTHYLNPDTDGDGLGDLQEHLLGSDARSEDTDHDLVSDGDEFFLYGTEPFLPDTDYDGLTDGEELFFFHSNPRALDSDADGLSDGAEVLDYGTDPMDEDSDNDGLTDYEEINIYLTDPRIPDTDGDGLLDGEEIGTYRTDPLKWDTDDDSITYLNESGKLTYPLSDGDEVKRTFTDPLSGDTDNDRINDGWELYLGSGWIPEEVLADPIALNPSSNDTDGDGLLDGEELILLNRTSLIHPYVAFHYDLPTHSRPDRLDTDGDGVSDWDEVRVYLSNASRVHSDNDNLPDGDEVLYHGTHPAKNDTDGDGLLDNEERTLVALMDFYPTGMSRNYRPIYPTNATESDTDRDRLPDGAELFIYNTNPRHGDENGNGLPDGLDYDTDHDMLEDGLEYYGYYETENGQITWVLTPTINAPTKEGDGGPFNPDSDHDGIADGLEFYGYHTNASNWDTDNDSFSDGFEIMLGSDPLTPAADPSAIYKALDSLNGTVVLLIPREPVKVNNVPIVAKILGNATATQVSYRIRSLNPSALNPQEDWSEPELLDYNDQHDQWESSRYLKNGVYELEVIVIDQEGKSDTNHFLLRVGEISDENLLDQFEKMLDRIPKPILPFILGLFMAFVVYLGLAARQLLIKRLIRRRKEKKGHSSPVGYLSEEEAFGKEDA